MFSHKGPCVLYPIKEVLEINNSCGIETEILSANRRLLANYFLNLKKYFFSFFPPPPFFFPQKLAVSQGMSWADIQERVAFNNFI